MSYSSQTHAIISYIEAHIKDEKIDYEELEAKIGFSLVHIRDLFQKNTGCSLVKYVRTRKIMNSTFDLVHSEQSIMNIALKYGFSNHESFTRAFKKIVGVTPSEFRNYRVKVGKNQLAAGVYGLGLLEDKGKGAMTMIKEKYVNNDSTILYGVPKVGWGSYGGNTPYAICLKACADYLGDDINYEKILVELGAAFRLTWNDEEWDLGNVDIYHTFNDEGEAYELGAKVLGRQFEILGRDAGTTKEQFKDFIKAHVDEGYPCIALGIIGPPEACLITGYRDGGDTLLGWNFFQDDQDFASSVDKDECGYFISKEWWENSDTQAVMCIGDLCEDKITDKEVYENAVKVLTGRKQYSYCKGIQAYDAWVEMLGDNSDFSEGDNFSVLFHKMLCQNDAMTCLIDGRGCAAEYFRKLAEQNDKEDINVNREKYKSLANTFSKVKDTICKMQEMLGGWEDVDNMLSNLADAEIREKICNLIKSSKALDKKSLEILRSLITE